MLEIESISQNPYQPRKGFDAEKLEELAESFKENGIIQPIIVRKTDSGYQLIAGERRLQAAKLAGMRTIPSLMKETSDLDMLKMSLVENIQRADLNPMEEAVSYNRLAEEFGLNRDNLAATLGKSRAGVTNTMRLLKLPVEVREEIAEGKISRGHALAVLGLESPGDQIALGKKIIAEGLSVRETERLVRIKTQSGGATRTKKRKTPEIYSIEEKLKHLFGTKVNVNVFKKGGRIEIEYYSEEDLSRILSALHVKVH